MMRQLSYLRPVLAVLGFVWCIPTLSVAFTVPSSFTLPSSFRSTNRFHHDSTPLSSPPSSTTALFGIPKMFRWLSDQYPDIINRQLEEGLAPDLQVDSFYLDMNGIIHPCTHGNAEGEIIILDETAMFKKIFLYVDRLYKLVQPDKLLYLAVDGVAPRAKMNQQRSRRFRSAKEAEMTAAEVIARKNAAGAKGPKKSDEEWLERRFDSNCITPGTDFMLKLSIALQKWVEFKMKADPFWQNGATVIVSGPDVPGEGEHKVMDFLRDSREQYYQRQQQRNDNDADDNNDEEEEEKILWEPNWTHVLYGLDADLIMLGLVSHEPNFMLLREKMSVVMAGRGRNKYRKKKDMMEYTKNDFEVLELSSLRQLLALQFRRFDDDGALNVDFDLNRVVDDFVFMCMLVGNDFLSHMPHMEIDGGAISMMMSTYIDLLPEWGDYLTKKEQIHPQRFEQFLYHLAVYEEEHFKRRGFEENEPGWKLTADAEDDICDFYGEYFTKDPTPEAAKPANRKGAPEPPESDDPNIQASGNRGFRRQYPTVRARSYRDFYYETKMGWKASDRNRTLFRRRAHVRDYIEGLHWNLNYYHNGCCSWDWYFPHLYSPLCTDVVNLHEFYEDDDNDNDGFKSFPFELGTPFPSLAQLLSVLPPQSAQLLPPPLGELMINPASPLTEYYPPDFTTDPNGKRQSWEAVVEIPFIDADILLDTMDKILEKDKTGESPLLTKGERLRNVRGKQHVFAPPRNDEEEEHNGDATTSSPKVNAKGSNTAKVDA
ncbi:5'-3' exoribonuclease [Seminavis robusta]|uniref:5'-3' exoribonuclease n=1 Tax=Seminavis robusta TaxID=568900 RepID=A0A9N8HL26_9STRA|nr:5'-3' exoribonuclease [Seminavis robusta]|eukprot:Sro654_g182080.1 5'-3' exoribonuclease (768) ;mRNA; r:27641-30192